MLVTVQTPCRTARLSEHARQRCREMGLRTKAVKAVVADPEMDTPAPNGGRLLVAGALAVIYDADANQVVTVLWAQGESRAGGPVRRTLPSEVSPSHPIDTIRAAS